MRETVDTIPLSDGSAAISGALDTAFDVEAIVDGDTVSVWWGPAGGPTERIFVAEEVPVLANAGLALVADEDFEVRYDNIVLEHHNSETTHYTYNAANELTRMVTNGRPTWYEYDEWGRRTLRAQGSHAAEYEYRYGDKLKNVQSSFPGEADAVAYIYDGLGKMRYRQVEEDSVVTDKTWYRYDLGWNVLGEYADHGGSFWWVDVKERGYVWDISNWTYVGNLLSESLGGNPNVADHIYFAHDRSGSTRLSVDDSMSIVGQYSFNPYGTPSMITGHATKRLHAGQMWDEAIGMYFYPYRHYVPNEKRWLIREPFGLDGPNMYHYGFGNPVNGFDYLGLNWYKPWRWFDCWGSGCDDGEGPGSPIPDQPQDLPPPGDPSDLPPAPREPRRPPPGTQTQFPFDRDRPKPKPPTRAPLTPVPPGLAAALLGPIDTMSRGGEALGRGMLPVLRYRDRIECHYDY